MKLIMKLDGIPYKKEKIIKSFKDAGVDDEDFFDCFATKKKIVYARYENHKDFCVWRVKSLKDKETGLQTFDSFLAERDYVELKYNATNKIYIGEI